MPSKIHFLCHLSFWFGLVFVTPLFLALNNPDDITFSVYAFAGGAAAACAVLSVLSWRAAALLSPAGATWVSRLAVVLALVMAVQGNIVHDLFDYGAFNGEAVNFRNYGWKFWLEWASWLAAIPLLLWGLSRLKSFPGWLPWLPILSFTILLAPAVMTADVSEPTADLSEEIDPSVFAFSKQFNLVHLLPDGFQNDVAHDVLEAHPELAEKFRGFTFFSDHVGRYPGTAPSMYSFLTGKAFDFEQGWNYKEVMPDIQQNSYQNALQEQGFQVDYVPISGFICIPGANSCHSRPFNDMKARGFFRHQGENLSYTLRLLADLTLFRLSPMFLKEKIHNQGYWFLADTTLDGSSPWPDPIIHEWIEHMQIIEDRPVYKWYHYVGTHIPPKWDRNCELQRGLSNDRENYVDQAYCVLTNIAALIDALQQAGVYDQTAFIISGDHGHNTRPADQVNEPLNYSMYDRLIGTGRPALMVKPAGASAPLAFSELPTDIFAVAPTALDLAGLGYEGQTAFDVPETLEEPRIFQRYDIGSFWSGNSIPYVEYQVTAPGNDAQNWAVSNLRPFVSPPAGFEPMNHENGNGFVMGAQLRKSIGNKDSAWVRGRQLAFIIEIPEEPAGKALTLNLHTTQWMPQQAFSVRFNGGEPQRVDPFPPSGADAFWRRLQVPLPDGIESGTQFVSVLFDQAFENPDAENWFASALLRDVAISEWEAPLPDPEPAGTEEESDAQSEATDEALTQQ